MRFKLNPPLGMEILYPLITTLTYCFSDTLINSKLLNLYIRLNNISIYYLSNDVLLNHLIKG